MNITHHLKLIPASVAHARAEALFHLNPGTVYGEGDSGVVMID